MPHSATEPMPSTCLIVIDGWGISGYSSPDSDAILNAKTPVITELIKTCPSRTLSAHGLAVGLPDGLMGNSEVGHLNLGAGRVVYQDIVRIDAEIGSGRMESENPVLSSIFNYCLTGKPGKEKYYYLLITRTHTLSLCLFRSFCR
jgi:2,3-bisphosphoglycerate-independent phosphoglycerate mutase